MNKVYVDCTVCGTTNSRPFFIENGHTIVRCSSCGHVYENPIDFTEVHDHYADVGNWIDRSASAMDDFQHHPRGHIYRFALNTIKKQGLSGGRILEVGCSRGDFLQFMQQHGYESWGVEPGEDALAAKQKKGVRVERAFIEDFEPGTKFAAIFFLDVLEHIPNPHMALKKIFDLLEPSGVVVAMVPNFYVQQIRVFFGRLGLRPFRIIFSPGNHINHFSPHNLQLLFERSPFQTVSVCNSPIDLQYVRGLPRYHVPLKKSYWKVSSIIEGMFGIQLAGSITAIGIKKGDK